MKLPVFFFWFLVTVLATFAEGRFSDFHIHIEFGLLLTFFIIRNSSPVRTLIMVFLLSLGMDLILQSGNVKGISAMSELLLVYGILQLKKHVIPQFEQVFLITFFIVFYLCYYYLNFAVQNMFGLAPPSLTIPMVILGGVIHLAIFVFILSVVKWWERKRQ